MRRILRASCLAIILLAGLQSASAADTASSPTHTSIKLLTPFGPNGLSIGMAVTEKVSGKCFVVSLASPSRPDAWRCSSGNGLLDPCYQRIMGDEKQLACPVGGPWPANVILLTLNSPLPSEPRKEITRAEVLPWALELANGHRCTLFTSATAPVAGMRINYGCPGGFQVVGEIDRSQPVWRVFFHGEKSIALEQADVTVAWF